MRTAFRQIIAGSIRCAGGRTVGGRGGPRESRARKDACPDVGLERGG